MGNNKSFKILMIDDSKLNREILRGMLEDEYEIDEADNGADALEIIENAPGEYDLVLLDIVMPQMDGFQFLEEFNRRGLSDAVPVIAISAEDSNATIHAMYELGAVDYIVRPFDYKITKKRVSNTIRLFVKQRKLEKMVMEKTIENKETSDLMTAILSHVVEFRNGESGAHVLGIKKAVEVILKELISKEDRYNISYEDIPVICDAATLHDIGKISIPDEIINKPGKLTDQEFATMKSHTTIGASMLENLPVKKKTPLVKYAYEICRWHHERYDGGGYPDGLKGDEIPMSAQTVALADVYDALTADRCYRKGFTHEEAVEMILGGQCGTFNPVLMECFKKVEGQLKDRQWERNTYLQVMEADLLQRIK